MGDGPDEYGVIIGVMPTVYARRSPHVTGEAPGIVTAIAKKAGKRAVMCAVPLAKK